MRFIGIIPARYNSSRFPGKPLAIINNKSMIARVYEQASKANCLSKVVVATDDERIKIHLQNNHINYVLTSVNHPTGTDRCFEAVTQIIKSENSNYDVVINIQGDHPYIDPSDIDLLAYCFIKNPQTEIATLIKTIDNENELHNPNTVKVITDINNKALYFSRSVIPYLRDIDKKYWFNNFKYFKHLGIYAFKTDILKKIISLKPSTLEKAESLEQLRWLQNGFSIYTEITNNECFAVDTPEDIQKLSLLH